jgi:cytosol aminopeptidase family protein
MKPIVILAAGLLCAAASAAAAASAGQAPFPVVFEGVRFDIVEQAPHLQDTPLQVFGVVEYKTGDGFTGADVEMDEALHGLIQDLRKNHRFEARLGENILLTPTNSTVVAKRVLVMGLGDPSAFKAQFMDQLGATDIREVCRMGLSEFTHASDVQDAGLVQISAGLVAEHVFTGMIKALRLQQYLASKGMAEPCPIKHISYLAGPKYFRETTEALTKATTSMAPK